MAAFFKRFFAYLCLSLALALALGPYSDRKKSLEDSPRVLISAVALTAPGLASACPDRIYDFPAGASEPDPEGSADADQAMAKAVLDLTRDLKTSNYTSVDTRLALKFIKQLTGAQGTEACFRSQGQTFKLIVSEFSGASDFFLVGISPDQVRDLPSVSPEELEEQSGLSGYLAGLAGGTSPEPVYDQAETGLNVGEWQSLRRQLGLAESQSAVRAGDFLLYGTVEERKVQRLITLKGLWAGRLVVALALLLPGLWFGYGLYRPRPGFTVGPPWTSLTGDLLLILVGTAGAYGWVEAVQGQWFAAEPYLPLNMGARFLTLGYLPYLAWCAWLKIKAGTWGLDVTDMGLVKYGPGRARTMAWEDIQGLSRIRESGRVDRELLEVRLDRGKDLAPWPPRIADREALLAALKQKAPQALQKDVQTLARDS